MVHLAAVRVSAHLRNIASVQRCSGLEAQADTSASGGGELMVLVFNLGGGTCDASLISLDAGILEVPPSCGSGTAGLNQGSTKQIESERLMCSLPGCNLSPPVATMWHCRFCS